MKAKLAVEMDNAAFADDGNHGLSELAKILREAADKVECGHIKATLRDTNGNTVGTIEIEED